MATKYMAQFIVEPSKEFKTEAAAREWADAQALRISELIPTAGLVEIHIWEG